MRLGLVPGWSEMAKGTPYQWHSDNRIGKNESEEWELAEFIPFSSFSEKEDPNDGYDRNNDDDNNSEESSR